LPHERRRLTEADFSGLDGDWTFHQATGMVAVQLGMSDMELAAQRLVTMATQRGEPVIVTASLVVARQLRLTDG
jgi:hypothetical protein